jgi:hypothetical protein
MLRGQEKTDPVRDSLALTLKVKRANLRKNQKMEIIEFLFEFTAVTVVISAVAALILTSRFASSKKQNNPKDNLTPAKNAVASALR